MCKFGLFRRPYWQEKTHRNAHEKAHKRAKLHKNAPFCTDVCNTPLFIIPPLACTQEMNSGKID